MFAHAALLLPDFLLIALGFLICRYTPLDRTVWSAAERLVYWLLFPVLLFHAIVKSPIAPAATLGLAAAALAVVGCGVVLAYALRWWPGIDHRRHASGLQVAFRFNSYVALALAERLGGAQAVTLIALVIALAVPLCNAAAVWALARHGGQSLGRELATNPLILSTLAGFAANLAGLQFPEALDTTLKRIGQGALPLGLMAVGAGLQLTGLHAGRGLAAALLGIRHVALPLVAIALAALLALPPAQALVLVVFAALPTASSCYVLAVRMGGDGPYVAALITLSTLLGMLSLPLWLAAAAGAAH
jgi:malonate transporter and related proteins